MGKVIIVKGADFSAVAVKKGWTIIDLTKYNLVGEYLTNNGWAAVGNGWLIPIDNAKKLKFKANSVGIGQISLCTGTTTSGLYVPQSTVTLQTGESSSEILLTNFPTAQGIFVAENYGGDNRTPSMFQLYY